MSNFLSHTVTLLVIKHTITPEHCTNIVPLCDKLYEAGQSCVCVFVMRPLRPIRVWSWRVLGNRWRRHANASALAHCRGRVRRCGPKSTYVYHIRLGVNIDALPLTLARKRPRRGPRKPPPTIRRSRGESTSRLAVRPTAHAVIWRCTGMVPAPQHVIARAC